LEGESNVDVLPLPKSQKKLVALVDVLVNVTVTGIH